MIGLSFLKDKPLYRLSVLLVLILLLSACNLPAQQAQQTATPDGSALSTFVAQTVEVGSQQSTLQAQETLLAAQALTLQAPSPSATLEPPPSPVLPTFTFTPPGAPRITADVDTNCRAGPSPDYPRLGYLLKGQESSVLGTNSSKTWWYIANPAQPSEACWVWGDTTRVSGDPSALAIITPPPLPQLVYQIGLANRHDCGGIWFFSFWAQNIGGLPVRSASIMILDQDTGISYGPDTFNSPFLSNPNACNIGNNALEPGDDGFMVSDLGFDIPPGTPVRAVVLFCSQDNLQGSCVESRIDFDAP
jgi:hypothetical protein